MNVDADHLPDAVHQREGEAGRVGQSYYPPRNDLTTFAHGDCDVVGGALPGCAASATTLRGAQRSRRGRGGDAGLRRAVHGTWTIPATLPAGDYALLVEVNKEFDNNAVAQPSRRTTDPQLAGYGLANNFGQPSVVYRVPIHIDVAAGRPPRHRSQIAGYSDWTGAGRRDHRARHDDLDAPTRLGRGAPARDHDRAAPAGCTSSVSPAARAMCAPPPPPPGTGDRRGRRRSALADTRPSCTFKHAQANGGAVAQLRDPLPRGRRR